MRGRARRWGARLGLLVGTAVLAYAFVVPTLVARAVRARLDAAGFSQARFEVDSIGLAGFELADVWLRDGLDLGDVEVIAPLWRLLAGGDPDIVLHGPRLDAAAVEAATATAPSAGAAAAHARRSPRARVAIERGQLTLAGTRLAIAGTIDLRPEVPAIDVRFSTDRMRMGDATVDDVTATVRGRAGAVRACGGGLVEGARVDACADLPSLAHTLDRIDVTWTARDTLAARWSAKGRGRVVRTRGGLGLRDGHAEVAIRDVTFGDVTATRATVRATMDGDLTRRAFTATGEVTAERLGMGTVALRGVTLPFALHGAAHGAGVRITSDVPVELRATGATIEALGTPLDVKNPSVSARGQLALAGGRVTLATSPDATGDRMRLALGVGALPLSGVLSAATRGRLAGTGVLAGTLEVDLDAHGWTVPRGTFQAIGGGSLRITDATLRDKAKVASDSFAIDQRIAAALADFRYRRLTVSIGRDPDVTIALRGRGRRLPQVIDVVLNLHGARAVANRRFAQLGGN